MRYSYRVTFAVALLALPLRSFAGEANLDPTFGTFGITVTNLNEDDDTASDVVRQADGKLVTVGSSIQER